MKNLLFPALLVGFAMPGFGASSAASDEPFPQPGLQTVAPMPIHDFQLIPGERAGAIALGMRSRELLAMLGKPSELSQRSVGIEEIVWNQDNDETRVILASDAVIQIEVTSAKYRDVLGNGTSSPLSAIFARYRTKGYDLPQRAIYSVQDPQGGGYESNIYDDVAAGIAYHVGTQDGLDHSATPDRLILHRAGKPAMAPKNATPISLAQKAAQEKAMNAPLPLPPKLWKNTRALGDGWPLTEIVTEEGARGISSQPVILPGRVSFHSSALIYTPNGLWHPLVFFRIASYNDRPVWQNAQQVVFSWGYRRLSLSAEKQTTTEAPENGVPVVKTQLSLRFPYRDFLEMAGAGKFVMSIGDAQFQVERAQTVGLRALARVCGGQEVKLDSGQTSLATSSGNRPAKLARIPNRRPVAPYNEFFPQTLRRRLWRNEVSAMSDGDLRLAINEMFARHGLGFKDKTLQAKFEALGWYRARDERTYAVITARMNPTERANLDLLAAERKRR